jgi:protein phosphatase
MLVCPECQFENSDDQESCQECGTSLTHKSCPECNETIPINADYCFSCGAFTGHLWRAIIALQSNIHIKENEAQTQDSLSIPSFSGEYLDSDQRYHLLNADLGELSEQFLALKVVDSKPLHKSSLDITLEEHPEILQYIADNSGKFSESIMGVPSIALSYLRLEEFYPLIPDVQDSWMIEDNQLILVSDRSNYKLLSDLLSQKSLSLVETLYWLDEIIKPWKLLLKVGCSQSLLEPSNLRIDQDESFCLQQLYFDATDKQSTLKDLANTYQVIISNSVYKNHPVILNLIEQLQDGQINSVDQLHTILQEIAVIQEASINLQTPSVSSAGDFSDDYSEDSPTEALFDTLTEAEDAPTVVLPMQLDSLVDASASDIGLQRIHNEDFFGITTEIKKQATTQAKSIKAKGLYIVCDGMGGHEAGEVASAMAVTTLQSYFEEHWQNELPDYETIKNGILAANNSIYEINKENQSSGSGRMGTTMVMTLIHNTKVAIAHVGDSRIYRFTRKGGLEQLTLDHEVGQREILRGIEPEIAYARPDSFQLTQALGPRNNNFVEPDINFFDINEDSLFILCSDGLSDNNLIEEYTDSHFAPLLSSSSNLDEGVLKLIDLANEYNSHDNITIIVIRMKVRPNLQEQIWL